MCSCPDLCLTSHGPVQRWHTPAPCPLFLPGVTHRDLSGRAAKVCKYKSRVELFPGIRVSVQYSEHTYTTHKNVISIYLKFHCNCMSCALLDEHTPVGLLGMWQVLPLGSAPAPALGPLLSPVFLGIHPQEPL